MKHLLSFLLLASLFLSGCNNKSQNGQLSTDLVTSPKSATQTSDKQAAITFEKEEHDFGSLLQGEVVSYSFHFTNTGNAPLIISQVTSSCGCTVANAGWNSSLSTFIKLANAEMYINRLKAGQSPVVKDE